MLHGENRTEEIGENCPGVSPLFRTPPQPGSVPRLQPGLRGVYPEPRSRILDLRAGDVIPGLARSDAPGAMALKTGIRAHIPDPGLDESTGAQGDI